MSAGSALLENAYGEALIRIDGQIYEDQLLARRAICWISYARRTLSTNELCHALAIEPGTTTLDPKNISDIEDIISVCTGLVIMDQGTGNVRFAHYTTQKYFERVRSEWSPYAEDEIAAACLTYLSFDTFRVGSCPTDESFERRLDENAFLEYSARYWGEHVRPVESSVSGLALAFLLESSLVDCTIQVASVSDTKYPDYSTEFPRQTTGLHLTARYGLPYLTQRLLSSQHNDSNILVNSEDSAHRTPVSYAASYNGHEQTVKLLLDAGADVNAQGGFYGNALQAASYNGHDQTVKLLLDAGADVNVQGGSYGNALQAASYNSHEQTVKLLLDAGAGPGEPTPQEFVKLVDAYVKEKPMLNTFFKDNKEFIQGIAKKAVDLAKDTSSDLGSEEVLPKTIQVTMHQQVIYCGN